MDDGPGAERSVIAVETPIDANHVPLGDSDPPA